MLKYILKRSLSGITVIIGVIFIVFFLFAVIPVNTAQVSLGQRSDDATLKLIEREFKLNQPLHKRFLLYLNDLSPISFHETMDEESLTFLDNRDYSYLKLLSFGSNSMVLKWPYLGRSFQNRRKIADIIGEKILPTALLALFAIAFATLIGVFLGTVTALQQGSWFDKATLIITTMGISLPSYFAGIIIAMIFGYYLGEFTGLDIRGPLIDLDDFGDPVFRWKNLVLPVIALGIRPVAIFTQLTRSAVLDEKSQDYIRTAKAKGLSEKVIVFKHLLRNALNPVITSISGWFAALLAGAFFIEIIFDYKGLGYQTVQALVNFNFPLVMGALLLFATIFVLINILTDILYGWLDPRISIR